MALPTEELKIVSTVDGRFTKRYAADPKNTTRFLEAESSFTHGMVGKLYKVVALDASLSPDASITLRVWTEDGMSLSTVQPPAGFLIVAKGTEGVPDCLESLSTAGAALNKVLVGGQLGWLDIWGSYEHSALGLKTTEMLKLEEIGSL